MRISVVIATYNRPACLELVLWGYHAQTDRDFEVVIADDGSGPETATLLGRMRQSTRLRITHVWHEDRGFRKNEILNRAIVASEGDYLVFTDGDCIPRHDVVEVHRALARPRRFVAGGYLKLPEEVSAAIGREDVLERRFSHLAWLRARGWRPGRRALRLAGSRMLGALFDRLTPTRAEFQGNNASTWREALFQVNGFEGEMEYGGLDKALGYRLVNAGVTGIQARHRAVALHLHHDRPYRREEGVRRNEAIMRSIRRRREIRARSGIAELPADPSLRINRG